MKVTEELNKIMKTQEEEVQLRLQFESKLNGLHSLHRDLEAKYERAKQEIFKDEILGAAQRKKIDEQSEELITLRTVNVENQAKVSYMAEQIKVLEGSNDQKSKQLSSLEEKLSAAL